LAESVDLPTPPLPLATAIRRRSDLFCSHRDIDLFDTIQFQQIAFHRNLDPAALTNVQSANIEHQRNAALCKFHGAETPLGDVVQRGLD